jgi:hypothetical protein
MAPIIANTAARTVNFNFLLMFVSCFGNQLERDALSLAVTETTFHRHHGQCSASHRKSIIVTKKQGPGDDGGSLRDGIRKPLAAGLKFQRRGVGGPNMNVALPNTPHARRVYEGDRTLHVVTDLIHKSDSPGFDRKRHDQ